MKANFLCWLADDLCSSLVPETSRHTLEELHEVFSQRTSRIVVVGWAQLKWLITGVGDKRRDSGRWVRSEYPSLVAPSDFRDEQELDDRGGLASGSGVTNNGFANQGTGIMSRRPTNAHGDEL